MADIVPFNIAQEISDACSRSGNVEFFNIKILENIILRSRIFLPDALFIDVFYNFETGKIAFALIKDENRIYGADNTGGWHEHPFDGPEKHIPCEPMSIREFLWNCERGLYGVDDVK